MLAHISTLSGQRVVVTRSCQYCTAWSWTHDTLLTKKALYLLSHFKIYSQHKNEFILDLCNFKRSSRHIETIQFINRIDVMTARRKNRRCNKWSVHINNKSQVYVSRDSPCLLSFFFLGKGSIRSVFLLFFGNRAQILLSASFLAREFASFFFFWIRFRGKLWLTNFSDGSNFAGSDITPQFFLLLFLQ